MATHATSPSAKAAPTLRQVRSRRDEILKLAEGARATNVRVFGSVARGTADVKSDIDFLVDLKPGATLLDLSGLILDLEDALGYKVSVVHITEQSPVTERILAEAVSL